MLAELLLPEALGLGKWGSVLCIFQPLMAARIPQLVVHHSSLCQCDHIASSSVSHLSLPPFYKDSCNYRASLVAQLVKNLPAMWETQVRSLV